MLIRSLYALCVVVHGEHVDCLGAVGVSDLVVALETLQVVLTLGAEFADEPFRLARITPVRKDVPRAEARPHTPPSACSPNRPPARATQRKQSRERRSNAQRAFRVEEGSGYQIEGAAYQSDGFLDVRAGPRSHGQVSTQPICGLCKRVET